MLQSNEFRQYAEEAMLSASQSKDEIEIKALTELAQYWVLAAIQSERAQTSLLDRELQLIGPSVDLV